LKNLEHVCYNTRFSHIYVERRIRNHPRTEQILLRFPQAQIVEIEHYKDVFNRHGQDCVRQHQAQALILAEKTDHFFYEGAPVCQDFGNTNFYYCSTMMNCIYDCSYCYLKGMYPSGHMVLFVNIEDYLEELDHILKTQNMYVCISYDADLLAMEAVTGYVRLWSAYAAKHENLKLEIRTKCAGHAMWDLPCLSNVIYAFTLSPQKMIDAFEKETPSAFARIVCAAEGLKKGFPVRLCFDPMLYLPSWKTDYLQLLSQIDRIFGDRMLHDGWEKLVDVSVGTFRISQEYMKKLRRVEPFAPAVQYPYVNCNGVYQYPPELLKKMENFMITELTQRMDKENIYYE
jgi:spore photoproduct lyase